MDLFLNAHKKFLLLLSKHKVKFLLIGGYAVIYHGYERTTNDLDVWLKPSNKNRDRFIRALNDHGVVSEKLNALKKMDFTKPQVLTIGKKPTEVELLTVVTGLDFEEADEKKNLLDLERYQIGFLGYEDLITNKMLTDPLRIKQMWICFKKFSVRETKTNSTCPCSKKCCFISAPSFKHTD